MLERELGFGMHVGRLNVTRRQLRLEDKRLAQELSSGDAVRFSTAIEALIASGAIRSGGTDEAVQTILANRKAQKPVDAIVLSSTHRLAERISEKLHEAYKAARPEVKLAQIAAFKVKQLQPTELLSTASYQPGEMIEYQCHAQKSARIAEVATVTADGIRVKDGRRLTMKLLGQADTPPGSGEFIQSQLKSVGIEVQIVPTPDTATRNTLYNSGKGDFDLDLEGPNQNDGNPAFLHASGPPFRIFALR